MTPDEAEYVAEYVKTSVADALKRRLITHNDVAEIAYASTLEAIRLTNAGISPVTDSSRSKQVH
jgi:hypothetical protein